MKKVVNHKKVNEKTNKISTKKIILLGIGVIILVAIIGIVFGNKDDRKEKEKVLQEQLQANQNYKVLENGTSLNVSLPIAQGKEIAGLKITNIQITKNNGLTTLIADVTNATKKTVKGFSVKITPQEKDGDEITTVIGYISTLKAGESTELIVSASYDFVNCYDLKIEKK